MVDIDWKYSNMGLISTAAPHSVVNRIDNWGGIRKIKDHIIYSGQLILIVDSTQIGGTALKIHHLI